MRRGLDPTEGRDLSALRAVGCAGSPLSAEGFDWVYDKLGPDIWLYSASGGTDVCSAFLAVFMLKALFFVRRGGMADTLEIKAEQQPRLFEFINRLADEAGAPRAHRVFLSARVNAAVFYDFSILNLLFPSRKNLEIGLALVNVLSLSEMRKLSSRYHRL